MPFLHHQTPTTSSRYEDCSDDDGSYEGFTINSLSGVTEVRKMEKYQGAENEAAELFRRPTPSSLMETSRIFKACAEYVHRHTELAECPRFAPKLALRFDQLQKQLNRCTDVPRAVDISEEACSMVASLVLRLAPPGDIPIKPYGTPPGNVPEMLDFLDEEDEASASQIDPMRPDARSAIKAIFEESLSASPYFNSADRNRNYGPSPDALIEAARAGVPFDTVRRRMLPPQASALAPSGNGDCGNRHSTKNGPFAQKWM
jgi:hypothetical protein